MARDIARELSGAVARTATQSVSKLRAATGLGARPDEQPPMAANEDTATARPDPTVVSANAEMKGSITTSDDLYIQGKIEGDVRAAAVMVCEGGIVRGDITADAITVYGAVTGNLLGGDVLLTDGSVVDGEITHTSLRIDAGANFEGSIKRKAKPAPIAAE